MPHGGWGRGRDGAAMEGGAPPAGLWESLPHRPPRPAQKSNPAEPLKPIQEAEAPTLPEPAAAAPAGSEPPNGAKSAPQRTPRAKRATISLDADAAPASAPVATNGGHESTATESTTGA